MSAKEKALKPQETFNIYGCFVPQTVLLKFFAFSSKISSTDHIICTPLIAKL